jgi:HptB-dependent secretion and biofilm anti anti-sigma factor
MTIETRRYGETLEAGFSHRLTAADHGSFRDILSKVKENGIKRLILDLSDLDWIDSSGLGLLILAKEAGGKAGIELLLRSPKGHVKELLELGHFDRLINIEF